MKTRSALAKSSISDTAARLPPVIGQSQPSNSYKQQSIMILKHNFPQLSVIAINRTFAYCHHSFAASYRILASINECVHEENDRGRQGRIVNVAPFLKDTKRLILKTERKDHTRPCEPTDPTLLVELDTIPEMNTKENRPVVFDAAQKRDDAKLPSEAGFVCGCCFDDGIPFENMCACNEGHLVCITCLRHYVNEQLDGKGSTHLQCMDMEADSKCLAVYSRVQLGRAFSPKSLEQVDEKIFRFNIGQAEMDDICRCPKCNHIFVEGASEVSCPECNHGFCRLCNEAPHKHKTCEEAKAEEKQKLDAHARAAQAMNDAVIRKCPKLMCQTRFFKVEGCNKMKCPCCGTLSCYLCRQEIKDYAHFCREPHCNHDACGKCVLFTDSVEDDRRARREVALAEQKQAGAAGEIVGGLLSPQLQRVALENASGPLLQVQANANAQQDQVTPPHRVATPRRLHAPAYYAHARQPQQGGRIGATPPADPQRQEDEDHLLQANEEGRCIVS